MQGFLSIAFMILLCAQHLLAAVPVPANFPWGGPPGVRIVEERLDYIIQKIQMAAVREFVESRLLMPIQHRDTTVASHSRQNVSSNFHRSRTIVVQYSRGNIAER
jgi:hypothetical protein